MRRVVLGLVVAGLATGGSPVASRKTYEASVVGLVVTHQRWNEDLPWQKLNPETRRFAGVVVEGPYILTTAQMIANATFIQAEIFGRATPLLPQPYWVDPEVNLALLKVDDPDFFRDLRPVPIARETPVEGVLRTVRWKGQQLESAASRVQRFEVQGSHFGLLEHVFVLLQTDLSAGGWSEPVFGDGHLVGITVSQDKQRVRAIPAEIIAAFLEEARSPETYRGFPVLAAKWQVNEDPALAAYLGQSEGPHGVLIRQVPWGSSGCGVLKPRDILLSIDGKDINEQGYYAHPRLGQLSMTNIVVDGHKVGDVVPVRVMRERMVMNLQMTLRSYATAQWLIPARRGNEPPPYVVAGGLIFRELDGDYLRSWGSEWRKTAPLNLLTTYSLEREAQQPERRRIVLLASVLPASYNVGYQTIRYRAVSIINGRPIDSINDVAQAFADPQGRFHNIELLPGDTRLSIVLDAERFEAATAEILGAYRVPNATRLFATAPPDGGLPCPGDY